MAPPNIPGLNIGMSPKSESITTPATAASSAPGSQMGFNRSTVQYDNPFLDMTNTMVPKSVKQVIRLIAGTLLKSGIVNQTIVKMSEYPITDLVFGNDDTSKLKDDQTVDFWKDLFTKRLKIKSAMKQANMDYHSYGNSIVSIDFPFKRMLTCPGCRESHDARAIKAKFTAKAQFKAVCRCGYSGVMAAKDISTKEVDKVRIISWDLVQMDIKYNSVSGEHFYYYKPDAELRKLVLSGDSDIVGSIRLELLDTIVRGKQLKLANNNVFHFKRISPQYMIPSERGWGISVLMAALADIFHIQILKKGNEMIAFDHINPLRVLFPQSVGDVSPHQIVNLGSWKNTIETELALWRKDPNRITVMPIPVGVENLFGDAKLLMIHQEIRFIEDSLITSTGIIPELIRGGASWSGSAVSLRVVENMFIGLRQDMNLFLEWLVDRFSIYFEKAKIDIHMSDFKMADDIQQKQLLISAAQGLSSASIIDKDTVIRELGFDPEKIHKAKLAEVERMTELSVREAEGNTEAQGQASIIAAMYQADAQIEGQKRMTIMQADAQQQQENFRMQQDQANQQAVATDHANLAAATSPGNPAAALQGISIPELIITLTQRYSRLANVDMNEFKIRMIAFKNTMPGLYEEVYKNLKEMNAIALDTMPDLKLAQKYTPGVIPTNTQGDASGDSPVSAAESRGGTPVQVLPEQKPPRSAQSSM